MHTGCQSRVGTPWRRGPPLGCQVALQLPGPSSCGRLALLLGVPLDGSDLPCRAMLKRRTISAGKSASRSLKMLARRCQD
jgi:hypothetical protein